MPHFMSQFLLMGSFFLRFYFLIFLFFFHLLRTSKNDVLAQTFNPYYSKISTFDIKVWLFVLNLKLFRYFLLIFVGNWIRRLRNCFFYLQSIMISGLNIMKNRTFFCSFHLIESLFFSLEVDFYLVYDSILPSALLIVVLGQVLIIVHHLAWSGTVDKIDLRVGKKST